MSDSKQDENKGTVASAAEDSKSSSSSSLTNSRGIPAATFIEDIPSYLSAHHRDCASLLRELQQLYGKYKFMENSLVSQQKALLNKLPEISAALQSVLFLQQQTEATTTHFELCDSLYAAATIQPDQSSVYLWLGANVMLEYSYEEAIQLLRKNLENAEISLSSLTEDLAFLKDQITISEVNIARVHNVNVNIRQQMKKTLGGGGGTTTTISSNQQTTATQLTTS